MGIILPFAHTVVSLKIDTVVSHWRDYPQLQPLYLCIQAVMDCQRQKNKTKYLFLYFPGVHGLIYLLC